MDPVFWIAIAAAVALAIWAGKGALGGASAADVEAALKEGVPVLDVRSPAEFASGHVKGALNIPHDQVAQRLGELGTPGRILIYCQSGMRSGRAAGVLTKAGFEVIDAKRLGAIPAEYRA